MPLPVEPLALKATTVIVLQDARALNLAIFQTTGVGARLLGFRRGPQPAGAGTRQHDGRVIVDGSEQYRLDLLAHRHLQRRLACHVGLGWVGLGQDEYAGHLGVSIFGRNVQGCLAVGRIERVHVGAELQELLHDLYIAPQARKVQCGPAAARVLVINTDDFGHLGHHALHVIRAPESACFVKTLERGVFQTLLGVLERLHAALGPRCRQRQER